MADKIGTDEYGEILIYQTDDGQTNIEVKIEDDTVWLTQQQMSELFQTSRTNVVEHIKHIYEEGELDEISTCRNFRQVRKEGNREVTRQIPHYNLDMIISLGYRIKSVIATRFRQWSTKRLKEYMIKGFTIDDERLKGNGGGNYWKELLDRIRDIRSSEKVLYRQVLDLYATSVDYNPHSEESVRFFKIAKNYLEENELKVLNNLVSGYFDLAEINAIEHKPMYMDDYVKQLDSMLSSGNRKLLTGAGSVSHKQALEKAKSEYRKYQEITLTPVEKAYLESIKEVSKEVKRR